VSTSDSDSTSSTTLNGVVDKVTTSTTEDRTSADENGSTVVKSYTIYTDTTTTPVTTTITVTTTRTTTWSDSSTTNEVIGTLVTDSAEFVVSVDVREELTNAVVTPNVVSTSTVYKNERTASAESELISELYGTNSDTIPVGTDTDGNTQYQAVTLYYYSWYRNVQSTTLKDEYTRTTYTDGSVVDVLVTVDIETIASPTKTYLLDPWGGQKTTTQRVPVGETFIGNPVAPDGSSGSSGVYTYAQRSANHDTNNYNTGTYYNSDYLGTPTNVASNNPTNFETTEAENGAVLVTYANHAYARGWTGKGSTALIWIRVLTKIILSLQAKLNIFGMQVIQLLMKMKTDMVHTWQALCLPTRTELAFMVLLMMLIWQLPKSEKQMVLVYLVQNKRLTGQSNTMIL
jgi:hypothetical protein